MQIELAKTVAARPTAAFAIIANVVDWPEIISSIKSVEVLTPGPIRAGTRLREDRIMFGRGVTQELEIATIECPHRLRLLADHQDLHYELDHVIDAVYGGGCRMMLIFRSRPATPAGRALQPLSHRSWKLHCGTSWSRTYPISRLRSADMVHTEASRELARGISDRHRGKKKASWWGAFLDDRQGRPTPTDAYFTPTK